MLFNIYPKPLPGDFKIEKLQSYANLLLYPSYHDIRMYHNVLWFPEPFLTI